MQKTKLPLSIVSITYNHELFIADALNSWLNQKLDVDFEIIIGDDCSQDRTVHIIKEFQNKYPGKIKLIENSVNLGHQKNLLNVLNESEGDLIAICAGDDYWIDSLKIQKQLDVFKGNLDCKMVYTNCYFLYGNEMSTKKLVDYTESFSFSIGDYISQKYITIAPTSMIRRIEFKELEKETFFNSTLEDEYLFSYLIKEGGKIYYIPDITGCYRVHPNGINSQQQIVKQLYFKLSTLNNLKSEFTENIEVLNSINSFINSNIDRLYHYSFNGFYGLSKWKVFKLIFGYQKKIIIDYRLYYNWFLKKSIGK